MSDHILVVTDRPCAECGTAKTCELCLEDRGEFDWSITCPGVSSGCESYQECGDCPTFNGDFDAAEEWDEQMWEEPEAHGVEHHRCLGEWMVPTGQCWVQNCPYTSDAVYDLTPWRNGVHGRTRLPAGEYPIDFDVIDEEYIELTLKEPVNAA